MTHTRKLLPGTVITVEGYQAKDGAMRAHGRVITYQGWPLYTYLGDASPGHAAGQGKNDDGGYWYVMRPSGQIVSP